MPTSRGYVHAGCGRATTIGDDSYESMCNPFYHVVGTICVHCGTGDQLDRFRWFDTGEQLDHWRDRLRAAAPAKGRRVRQIGLLVIWGVVALIVLPLAGLAFAGTLPLAAVFVPLAVLAVAGLLCQRLLLPGIARRAAGLDMRGFE